MSNFGFERTCLKDAIMFSCFHSGDNRGGFTKIFKSDIFMAAGIEFNISEIFLSRSSKNVIRGMHFQTHNPQAKIVSVISGSIWDVIVDLRPNSETYMRWASFNLSGDDAFGLYIPRGFAHGFLSKEDDTVMLYQCDGDYDADTDTGIRFDDPDIAIEWPVDIGTTIHSKRDLSLQKFKDYLKKPMELKGLV